MPTAKKLEKKSSGGLPKIFLLIILLVVIIGVAIGGYFLFYKGGLLSRAIPSLPKITKPSEDMSRARVMTLDPESENVMQVTTREKVIITLTIPKGAIDKKQNIKMIPYYYNEKSGDPSAGVILSPGNLAFKQPVTLLFDLSDSKLRTDAPTSIGKMETVRASGKSQVLMIDQNASELIPVLVAREVETSTQLRARVLTGGGYVFSVDGKDQKRWAENAMSKDKINSLSILEAAKVLLSEGVSLNKKDKSKANAAADKILGKKLPPSHEMVAALTVKKLLDGKKTGFNFVPKAFAVEGSMSAAPTTNRQVIEFLCKSKGYKVEDYVGFAAAAATYGFGDLRDKCMTVALNMAANDARKLLADKNASIKSMLIALKNLQFLGIDEADALGDKLTEKIKWKAEDEAKRVAYDIDATPIEMATELQKLQELGVEGKTADTLTERLVTEQNKKEANYPTPPPEDYEQKTDYSEEQVLVDQAWNVVGIELLKVMGFKDFSEEGLKDKFKEMTDNALLLNEAAYEMCKEFNGDNCDSVYNESKQKLEDNLQEGYRVAGDVGTVQNSAYEEPEYDDAGGSYYYELTPTPDEEYYQNLNDGEENAADPLDQVEDNHDQGALEDVGAESQNLESDTPSDNSGDSEDVQGASTLNIVNIVKKEISKIFH